MTESQLRLFVAATTGDSSVPPVSQQRAEPVMPSSFARTPQAVSVPVAVEAASAKAKATAAPAATSSSGRKAGGSAVMNAPSNWQSMTQEELFQFASGGGAQSSSGSSGT